MDVGRIAEAWVAEEEHHKLKCPKCDRVQSASNKKCVNCGHDLADARKAKFANLSEAGSFDPAGHPRGTHGHFARKLEGLHVGETVNLPTAVTIRRRPDGFHVRVPGKAVRLLPNADRAATVALREHRARKRREKLIPEGDSSVRALAQRLGYAVPLTAVYR